MSDPVGYFALVLHAHLPFVRHPEYDDFLEEDWLLEAITESYVPLLDALDRLISDGVPVRITLTISPTLCEMLSDPLLQKRYMARLNRFAELAEKEVQRTAHGDACIYHDAAHQHQERIHRTIERLEAENYNLIGAFRRLREVGVLEIITSGATHGFLPLMKTDEARRAQLLVANSNYEKHFGAHPTGVWLPECGYDWRVDELLEDVGLKFYFLDSHGILFGTPRPKYGVYAPVLTPFERVAFARDADCSRQVWSRESGYPGDPEYREFYRDLGYDAPYEYIRPYLHNDGVRRDIGFKYHRITGQVDLGRKAPYRPHLALRRASKHAAHFVRSRVEQCRKLRAQYDRPPLVLAAYDAELFGHWWYEGPAFIEGLFRELHNARTEIQPLTPLEYLDRYPRLQSQQPAISTWGRNGFNEVWLNEKTDWIYRHLHECEARMLRLAENHPEANEMTLRALNQAARELLLAQSSDWAFQMTMDGAAPYAQRRTREHIHRFQMIYKQLLERQINPSDIQEFEQKALIFPEIDYRVYSPTANNVHAA